MAVLILVSQIEDFQEEKEDSVFIKCDSRYDKNRDNIPDELDPRKNVDWSNCNLQGTNFSEKNYFEYETSLRPFTWGLRYHTSSYSEPIRDGIANDAHTFRQHQSLGIIDKTIEEFYAIFGIDYDPDDKLYSGPNFENANFTNANFSDSKIIDGKLRFTNLENANFTNSHLMGTFRSKKCGFYECKIISYFIL